MPVAMVDREPRVAELMGIINAATAELTALVASVLEDESWQMPGISSPQHWVRVTCGVSARRAVELVRVAERRAGLPRGVALFDAGLVSEGAGGGVAPRGAGRPGRGRGEPGPRPLDPPPPPGPWART